MPWSRESDTTRDVQRQAQFPRIPNLPGALRKCGMKNCRCVDYSKYGEGAKKQRIA